MINRLSTIYELQLIDDLLDELEELRGDLPLAVNDLKSDIQNINEQIDSKEKNKKESLDKRKSNDEEIERLNKNLKKFKSQLYQVRNNKEYDALTKEIDHSEGQIDKLETENLQLEDLVEKLKMDIEEIKPRQDELKGELKSKESELKRIVKANEREEVKLNDKREKIVSKVRPSDYNTYKRIRKAKGGKAIASINRSACSGCHNIVPPQRQIEIKQSRRLYTCESCGRLLVSPEIVGDVESSFKS